MLPKTNNSFIVYNGDIEAFRGGKVEGRVKLPGLHHNPFNFYAPIFLSYDPHLFEFAHGMVNIVHNLVHIGTYTFIRKFGLYIV